MKLPILLLLAAATAARAQSSVSTINRYAYGDGQSDSAEYAAGTNRTDRTDFLRITSLNYLPGNNAGTLHWTAVQNRAYRVEQSTDL
jgi:hypothetical protein